MVSLYDWFLHYLKQKDLHFGHIKEIKPVKKDFFFVLKVKKGEDSHEFGYVNSDAAKNPEIDEIISVFEDEKSKHANLQFSYIALFNTDENLKYLNAAWEKLLKFKFLKVYFVNPYSDLRIWALNPYSHNFIGGTKKALKVFFDDLGEIKETEIKKFEKDSL